MNHRIAIVALAALLLGAVPARPHVYPPSIRHVIVFILENEERANAEKQPFFAELARRGATLRDYAAVAHPSRPNYIAMISGSTQGVKSDRLVTVDARHLGDLLEARGLDWRVYAEDYPGRCFLGDKIGRMYARRHTGFLDFANVQRNPARCAKVVNAAQLALDAAADRLPAFALYVPNNQNNGHDTSVAFADRALRRTLGPMLDDPHYATTLFVVTFDEDDYHANNHIYTAFVGAGVRPGAVSGAPYTHYSLLRTIEELFDLGTLHANDETAPPIRGVWQ